MSNLFPNKVYKILEMEMISAADRARAPPLKKLQGKGGLYSELQSWQGMHK